MARERPFIAVYLMASRKNGTLYIGVTSDLWLRVLQHKQGRFEGFAKKYRCTGLVWFESFDSMRDAFQAETSMKRWARQWKLRKIEERNPEWEDLARDWYDETTNRWLIDPTSGDGGEMGSRD